MGISFDKTKIPGGFPPFWRGEFKVLPGDYKLKQTFTEGTLLRRSLPIVLDFENMECAICKVAKVITGGTTSAPRVKKGHVMEVGDVVMKLSLNTVAPTISAIDTSNDNYDVITLDAAIAGLTTGDFLQEASAVAEAVAEVKGVYTLTIGTAPTAGDILTVDGENYEYADAEGDGVYAVGSNVKEAAANIEDALSAQYDGIFSVVAKNGKLIFTQLTGGTGDIPVISVTQTGGTLVASIVETTAGVAVVAAETAPLYEYPDAVIETTKEYTSKGFQTVSAGYEGVILKEVAYPIPDSWLTGFSLKNNPSIKYIKQ